MQMPSNFDPETVALMGRVCDEAFNEARQTTFFPTPAGEQEFRISIATRVMLAVADGERDAARLKALALAIVSPSTSPAFPASPFVEASLTPRACSASDCSISLYFPREAPLRTGTRRQQPECAKNSDGVTWVRRSRASSAPWRVLTGPQHQRSLGPIVQV